MLTYYKIFCGISMMKFVYALLALSLLTACGGDKPQETSSNATTQTTQVGEPKPQTADTTPNKNPNWETYLVGSELNFPPFQFKDEQGQPKGFEVELLYAVAKAGEFNVDIVNANREEFTEELNTNKVQIFSSLLTKNAEREAQVDFSEPFLDYRRHIYLLDTPANANLKTAEDFLGKKIAGDRSFSTSAKVVGDTGEVIKVESFAIALRTMYQGKADAVIADKRTLAYFDAQEKHANIKTRSIALDDSDKAVSFAIKKGNPELLAKINKGIQAVKADGTLDRLQKKWFGSQP